ncbi:MULTISPECIES: hypothetical protein [unclassified Streptomyces]|uniref:hypothetical protein n=1 Tax=unclassified Streptomyces TaxID=2593676 RepID=UPI0033210F4E
MFARLRQHVVTRQRAKAEEVIHRLRDDVEALGIGPVPGPLRVAIRQRYHDSPAFSLLMMIIYIGMLPIIGRLMDKVVRNICPGCATEKGWWIEAFNSFGQPAIAMALFLLVLRSANSFLRAFNLMTGVFLSLDVWAATIHECAEIVRAPRVRDQHYTGIVWRSVLWILDARAMRGTTGVSSWHRRKAMRRHAYRVADALREAEARLDVNPKESARTIAGILLKVSTRYAEGRLGALLDEEDLSSVPLQPHRFKGVRLLVTVVWIAAITIVGPTIGLSVQMTAAASVMVVAVAYRNTGLGVLSVVYPVLFPEK